MNQRQSTRKDFHVATINERAPLIADPITRAVRWTLQDARELQRRLPRNRKVEVFVDAFSAILRGQPVRADWLLRQSTVLRPPLRRAGDVGGVEHVS